MARPTWQSPMAAHRSIIADFLQTLEKWLVSTIDDPGNLKGIATPVCALARNDSSFGGCQTTI